MILLRFDVGLRTKREKRNKYRTEKFDNFSISLLKFSKCPVTGKYSLLISSAGVKSCHRFFKSPNSYTKLESFLQTWYLTVILLQLHTIGPKQKKDKNMKKVKMKCLIMIIPAIWIVGRDHRLWFERFFMRRAIER